MMRTSLFGAHQKLGAKIVPFAGYEMPVQYASVIQEAKAVRTGAGMFDVSHMARLRFRGADTLAYLNRVTSNDVLALTDGTGQYSLLPNENGGVVDDIIVYRLSEHEAYMVVNAANHDKDVAWLRKHLSGDVDFADETDATAMIAVQGPRAVPILTELAGGRSDLAELPAFGTATFTIAGVDVFGARSGYTGEDGFEIICPADDAEQVWDALRHAGVEPCGLASRDTLRVEAGLPLYGHELSDTINPIEAGLGWVIGKEKSFIGSEAIEAMRESGPPRKLQGIQLNTKRLLMPGMSVFLGDQVVGEITSGVYSPVLDTGIGFALLNADVKLKTAVEVDIRGKREPATVVSKRFYKRAQ